jgi:hypothetical protein
LPTVVIVATVETEVAAEIALVAGAIRVSMFAESVTVKVAIKRSFLAKRIQYRWVLAGQLGWRGRDWYVSSVGE